MNKEKRYKKELAELLARIKNPKIMEALLDDLFTPVEGIEISKRLQIVKRLAEGESQRQVAEDLKVGIATVTRGSRELKKKTGGFNEIINRFYKKIRQHYVLTE